MYFIRNMKCINLSEKTRYMTNMKYIRDIFLYNNIKYIEYRVYINYNLYKLCISYGHEMH